MSEFWKPAGSGIIWGLINFVVIENLLQLHRSKPEIGHFLKNAELSKALHFGHMSGDGNYFSVLEDVGTFSDQNFISGHEFESFSQKGHVIKSGLNTLTNLIPVRLNLSPTAYFWCQCVWESWALFCQGVCLLWCCHDWNAYNTLNNTREHIVTSSQWLLPGTAPKSTTWKFTIECWELCILEQILLLQMLGVFFFFFEHVHTTTKSYVGNYNCGEKHSDCAWFKFFSCSWSPSWMITNQSMFSNHVLKYLQLTVLVFLGVKLISEITVMSEAIRHRPKSFL